MKNLRRRALLVVSSTLFLAVCGVARGASIDPAAAALNERAALFASARGMAQLRPLLGIEALDDESLDRGEALLAFLRRAADTAEEPLVAARAQWTWEHLRRRRGQRGASALHAIDDVMLVGPFSAELGAELPPDDKVGPEAQLLSAALSPDATFPSGLPAQLARVQRLSVPDEGGVLPLGAVLRPETRVAAFVMFAVESRASQRTVLRLGSTGAVVVWLNGRRLGAHVGERPLSLDADAYAAPLVAGQNRFVVRIAAGERLPELVLRLTDDRGRIVTPAMGGALAAAAAPSNLTPRAAQSIEHLLQKNVFDRDAYLVHDAIDGPRPDKPCDRLGDIHTTVALPFALLCATDDDAQRRLLDARLAALSVSAEDRARNARWREARRGLLDEGGREGPPSKHAQRRLLEVTHDRLERIALLTQLGELQLRGRTPTLGEARLLEAAKLGDAKETWRARLRLIDLEADRGFVQSARAELDALVREAPSERASEAVVHLLQRAGRPLDARTALEVLVHELPGDIALVRQLAAVERARERSADLERALQRLSGPHDLRDAEAVAIERVELLQGLGRSKDAVEELTAVLSRASGDARVEERLGRLLLASNDREAALTHLRRALELRPQSPELRTLLGDIDGARHGDDLAHRFAVDVTKLRERVAKDSLGRGDPARALYDGTTIRVHHNGLQESFVERVVEVGDRRGAEQEGTVYVRYAPDSQSVEVEVARVYKPSGEIVEAATVEERDLSEPWAGLYYDVRAQIIHLSGVEPGDVVHVAYTVSDHGRRNELGDAFCDFHMMQEGMARLESVYRLVAPAGRAIYFNDPHVGSVAITPTLTEDPTERRWDFTARDVPKLLTEPQMPGEAELGAHVHASTFATWADVAAFYRGLSLGQLEPDAAIRHAALAAVQGKTTMQAKVAAIYDLVVRSTRYVGLEFGVHGYQPYKVSQVWARRFGDCKDKASLLVAMLKEVGVPATLVLLRTLHEGAVEKSPPSLALFDHAIAYVPALDRYLDGTAELSGSTELPSEDQGTFALHIADGVLHMTPVGGPDSAELDERLSVTLAADGSAGVELARRVSGVAAEAWRRQYLPVAQRKEHLEQSWAQRSPGTEVKQVEVPHLEDRERPVELEAELRLPRLARSEGDGIMAVPVLLKEPRLLATLAPLSKRTHDLLLSHELLEREHVLLTLPKGAHAQLPEDAKVESRFGRFSIHGATRPDGRVEVDSETIFSVRRIAVTDYADFRAFLTAIDRAIAEELRVELVR